MILPDSMKGVIELARQANVRFVRLQFVDLNGYAKSVEVPIHQLDRALRGEVMFDGSSIEGFVRIEESDMYLQPDLATWVVLPDAVDRRSVARLICNVCLPEHRSFAGDPRTTLQRALARAKHHGFSDFQVGVEVEFFLLQLDPQGRPSLTPSDDAGYFDVATELHRSCLRDISVTLEQMGVPVCAAHHEVSPGQQEVVIGPTSAVTAADHLMTVKMVTKAVSARHGLHATFMPKPVYGLNGSGLHLRQSLYVDDQNAFVDPTDAVGLSVLGRHYIAGLLDHAAALTALTNPVVNSYKRLVPRHEAPTFICWSERHPSPMIRVGGRDATAIWVELRSPDAACNPYLALTAILCAGLDGIDRQLRPPASVDRNLLAMSNEQRLQRGILPLPTNLEQALEALEEDVVIQEGIGDHTLTRFVRAKSLEWNIYQSTVHTWEHDQYLDL